MPTSRETELANEHNVQNACDWIGNSVKVAMRHYLQTTEEDFERAVQPQKAKQYPKQLAHKDADLAELICAWSALPDALAIGIIAMVRASSGVRQSS